MSVGTGQPDATVLVSSNTKRSLMFNSRYIAGSSVKEVWVYAHSLLVLASQLRRLALDSHALCG